MGVQTECAQAVESFELEIASAKNELRIATFYDWII